MERITGLRHSTILGPVHAAARTTLPYSFVGLLFDTLTQIAWLWKI